MTWGKWIFYATSKPLGMCWYWFSEHSRRSGAWNVWIFQGPANGRFAWLSSRTRIRIRRSDGSCTKSLDCWLNISLLCVYVTKSWFGRSALCGLWRTSFWQCRGWKMCQTGSLTVVEQVRSKTYGTSNNRVYNSVVKLFTSCGILKKNNTELYFSALVSESNTKIILNMNHYHDFSETLSSNIWQTFRSKRNTKNIT